MHIGSQGQGALYVRIMVRLRSQEPASRRLRGGELMSQKVSVLVSRAITDMKPFVFISAFSLCYACIINFDDKLACIINLSFDSFFFFFFLELVYCCYYYWMLDNFALRL